MEIAAAVTIYLILIVGGIYIIRRKKKVDSQIKGAPNNGAGAKIVQALHTPLPGSESLNQSINEQVANYNTMNTRNTARGIAATCIVLFNVINLLNALQGALPWLVCIAVAIVYLPLAYGMYKGYKFAMVLTLIIWSIDRLYSYALIQNLIMLLQWFVVFIAIAKALQVEVARQKKSN